VLKLSYLKSISFPAPYYFFNGLTYYNYNDYIGAVLDSAISGSPFHSFFYPLDASTARDTSEFTFVGEPEPDP